MDASLSRFINENLVFLLFAPNVITYLLFGWDKHLAVYHRSRIPEAVLFFFTFLFGGFGALCGMIFFRHKTQHTSFLVLVPLLLLIQLAAVVLFRLYWQY